MPNAFARFFRDRDEPSDEERRAHAEALSEAREILDWAAQPYHKRFLDYLAHQGSLKIDVADPLSTTKGAVRNNTLTEIREHLQYIERRAKMLLDDAMRGD